MTGLLFDLIVYGVNFQQKFESAVTPTDLNKLPNHPSVASQLLSRHSLLCLLDTDSF